MQEGFPQFNCTNRDDGYPIILLSPEDDEYGEVIKKILEKKKEEGTAAAPNQLQSWIDRVNNEFPGSITQAQEQETGRNATGSSGNERYRFMALEKRIHAYLKEKIFDHEIAFVRRIKNFARGLPLRTNQCRETMAEEERKVRNRNLPKSAKLFKDCFDNSNRLKQKKINLLNRMALLATEYETVTRDEFDALTKIANDYSENGEGEVEV